MKKTLPVVSRGLAITCLSLGVAAGGALARGSVKEELHEHYPLSAQGEVQLRNVNGKVRVTTWDRNEVKLDAIKTADSQEHLDAVKIEIEAKADRINIRTKYPEGIKRWWFGGRNNSTRVEYTLTVPQSARLEHVSTVNGSLEITGVRGEVEASTVNGSLTATDLGGDTRLSTVNGSLHGSFGRLEHVKAISLKTVNGGVVLRLAPEVNAEVSAHTVNGGIRTDHPLSVKRHWPLGSELKGTLGEGGTRIEAHTVNGGIRIEKL